MSWAPASPRPPLKPHASSSFEVRRAAAHPAPGADDGLIPLLAEIDVFLVPAKIDVGEMIARIEALGGKVVPEAGEARLVVTALRGRPRLARVLGAFIDERDIVSAEFVDQAYEAAKGGKYALPRLDEYRVHVGKRARGDESVAREEGDERSAKRRRVGNGHSAVGEGEGQKDRPGENPEEEADPDSRSLEAMERRCIGTRAAGAAPDVQPYPEDVDFASIPRLACERPSPLVCPNQDIIKAIKPIYEEREYDFTTQINSNVLSYRRSMAIIKSVPRRIKSGKEARTLVDVGEKVANRIDEYLDTGGIEEAEAILENERFRALESFASVYSIGHSTAAQLWHEGCRDLEDVRRHYVTQEPEGRREERKARERKLGGGMGRAEIVGAWLELHEELDARIPRDEVREIAGVVGESLDALLPGCEWMITGGYRRGKEGAGDVDIVFKPPKAGQDIGLLGALYRRLARLKIVTHVLHVTARDTAQPLHSSGANFDNLDKAFVIFKLPREGALHRRVDLICSPVERYAAAVLSWSGSMMFERDLRRFIENRGYKFRAGLLDRDLNEINFDTEREIFEFVGLPFVPATLRNADG